MNINEQIQIIDDAIEKLKKKKKELLKITSCIYFIEKTNRAVTNKKCKTCKPSVYIMCNEPDGVKSNHNKPKLINERLCNSTCKYYKVNNETL